MKSSFAIFAPFFVFGLLASGCAQDQKLLPKHDEVLIYQRPYDLVYLRTLEALQLHKDWELDETEKETGVLIVRNMAYTQLGDADKRQIIFHVNSVGKGVTSVSIDPKSQQVLGGDQLLQLISEYMAHEL